MAVVGLCTLGCVGLCRAMYGYVWLCRAIGLYTAMYGYVGLCRVI